MLDGPRMRRILSTVLNSSQAFTWNSRADQAKPGADAGRRGSVPRVARELIQPCRQASEGLRRHHNGLEMLG